MRGSIISPAPSPPGDDDDGDDLIAIPALSPPDLRVPFCRSMQPLRHGQRTLDLLSASRLGVSRTSLMHGSLGQGASRASWYAQPNQPSRFHLQFVVCPEREMIPRNRGMPNPHDFIYNSTTILGPQRRLIRRGTRKSTHLTTDASLVGYCRCWKVGC